MSKDKYLSPKYAQDRLAIMKSGIWARFPFQNLWDAWYFVYPGRHPFALPENVDDFWRGLFYTRPLDGKKYITNYQEDYLRWFETPEKAAKRIGVSKRTVQNWIKTGKYKEYLWYARIGKEWFMPAVQVEGFKNGVYPKTKLKFEE